MSRLRITWTPSVVGPELGARVIEPKVDHLILSRQHRLNGRHRRVHDVGYSDQLLFQLDRPELHVDQVNEVGGSSPSVSSRSTPLPMTPMRRLKVKLFKV
jgi:hypothetical protein